VKISFDLNRIQMNYILEKIFNKRYKIGHFLDFPAGNMFWAKVLAIYQIFFLDINENVPKEKGQIDQTIMHGIERIWLFLVKLNGYYYQKMFKYY
jgi:lipopolysaccharide biosynthesis protein